jgi:sugar phosphate isomerase/epimerase
MMIDRRSLLAGAGAGAAFALFGAAGAAQAAKLGAIGLQLYTVRDVFEKDPVGTLEKIAKIGYREVEFGGGGYDKMDHALLRRTMDRLKLKAPSIHVPYPLLTDQFDAVVTMARTLGAETIVMPFLMPDQRAEAVFEGIAANLNTIGTKLRAAGFGFAYHNHDFEFLSQSRGVSLFERLMAVTDPAIVKFELDLYWAVRAGQDIPALVQRLAPRLYSFHVKDMKADRSMAAVGAGTIDFAAIFRLPGAAQVRHYYVENDQAPAPYFPDITQSFRTLRALTY